MPVQDVENLPGWAVFVADHAWQIALVLLGLTWAFVELRVRKMLDERDKMWQEKAEKLKADLRTEMQTPIGIIGTDAIKALDICQMQDSRLARMETKIDVWWKVIEHNAAGLLKEEDSR